MYAKIQITGHLQVETGLHIGGSDAFAAIGAIDSPVVRDKRTGLPMIPGSSLKGKLRALLARAYNENIASSPEADHPRIIRLFGSAGKDKPIRGKLLFSDMVLANAEKLRQNGLASLTEAKFENSINRATSVANPRQIERVVRGSVFNLDLIYECGEEQDISEDFRTLAQGIKLLTYDYLGGSGSRGYGKVSFHDIKAETVVGSVSEEIMKEIDEILAQ